MRALDLPEHHIYRKRHQYRESSGNANDAKHIVKFANIISFGDLFRIYLGLKFSWNGGGMQEKESWKFWVGISAGSAEKAWGICQNKLWRIFRGVLTIKSPCGGKGYKAG